MNSMSLGLAVGAWVVVIAILFDDVTAPETNTVTIHKQDRLQLPCPKGANE